MMTMDVKFEFKKRSIELTWYCFVLICISGQQSINLVSSEDISSFPLNLFQTKLLDTSEGHGPSDAKIEDPYKRGGNSAFYGLRGKKLSDSLEMAADDDKRNSVYPIRGKKKASAFTALRGKKVINSDNPGDGLSSEEDERSFSKEEKNSTPSQLLTNLKSNWGTWNSGMTKEHGDWNKNNPVSWINSLHDPKFFLIPNWKSDAYHFSDEAENQDSRDEKAGDSPVHDVSLKRASAFFPMRGRKSYSDESEQISEDKRPSAFIPMRGRKTYNDAQVSEEDPEFQKKSLGFLPMRGRRLEWGQNEGQDNIHDSTGLNGRWMSNIRLFPGGKRVAFHAVRGKKNSAAMDWSGPKRAFYASRGKRLDGLKSQDADTTSYFDVSEIPNFESSILAASNDGKLREKRSLQRKMSRGKSRTSVGIKRPITFFATRGKRFEENIVEPAPRFFLL